MKSYSNEFKVFFFDFFLIFCNFLHVIFVIFSFFLVNFSMAARRMRKTERGITDHDALLAAIRSIIINNVSASRAEKALNINVKSFNRYVSAFRAEVPDITALSDDELLNVVRRIATYETPSLVR